MAHGYTNLQGKFITTATKAEAVNAWRAERGYSTGGVYDMGGGEVVDTTQVKKSASSAPASTQEPTPAATLANTLAGTTPATDSLVKATSGYGTTPTVANAFATPATDSLVKATSGYGETTSMSPHLDVPYEQWKANVDVQRPWDSGAASSVSTPATDSLVKATSGYGETTSVASGLSGYQGPTGQVGPNEIVVENLADVMLTQYQNPDANIFYANPATGTLTAKAGIMAFVPALNQYLAGEDMPDSVVQTLVDLGLLAADGVPTSVGNSFVSGGGGGGYGRASGSGNYYGASIGLINWRIGF